ncbi:MAG: hypothetical protein NBV65_09280 [Burkholderiaceae bacterium]|nr:hypothetical protein [Burkholderiaceae bacterium]
MPKLKPDTLFPTAEEERQIAEAIASDPDDFEIDQAWIARAKPASEFFDEKMLQSLRALRHSRMVAVPDTEFESKTSLQTLHPRG